MKIISWNINSLRLRLPLLKKFVDNYHPDIICLQETKVSNEDFPLIDVSSLGFDFVEFDGEKSYNGVAIFSKYPINKIEKIDILNYGHKRHIFSQIKTPLGAINLHNFYVPAGGDIPDVVLNDKFDHKLKFIDWMAQYFLKNSQQKTIILGDFNIAPDPEDVWSHKQLLKVVSHTPIEVEKLKNLQKSLNFVDAHRFLADKDLKLYSWWSYRAKDPLQSNRGRRLDHIWITQDLKSYLKNAKIYRDFRIELGPSDHVPIEITIS